MNAFRSAVIASFAAAAFSIFPVLSPSASEAGVRQDKSEVGVYLPADKRHKGLSRFDNLPFTDRKLGDPDRYRALNPHFVQKENGQYYFRLMAEPGAHYFDEALRDKGTLPNRNVAVDVTQGKEAKGVDGKTARYVYAKDQGWVLRNQITPASEIRNGKWFLFPLKDGAHTLCDGTGIVRGTLAARSVRLNYGQQKQINGETYYYAFSTSILLDDTKQKSGASGWIKAAALQDGNDPQYAPEVVARMQPAPTVKDLFTAYEITGGDPQEKIGADVGGTAYKFGYADSSGAFVAYKVLPGVPLDGRASIAATDYLKRNDDVINLGFNVSGVSNDTYRVSSPKRPLFFYRSSDKHATAIIDLFYPKDATHDGLKPVGKMFFVYGYVDEGQTKRWGWIPLDALKAKGK